MNAAHTGKEILVDGRHFADAATPDDAATIVDALCEASRTVSYLEALAAKREASRDPRHGTALHADATILRAVASDLRAGLHRD